MKFKKNRCWVEINQSALEKNILLCRSYLSGKTRLMAVVKADGYGHGLPEIVRILAPQIDCFGVASVHEAMQIKGVLKKIKKRGQITQKQKKSNRIFQKAQFKRQKAAEFSKKQNIKRPKMLKIAPVYKKPQKLAQKTPCFFKNQKIYLLGPCLFDDYPKIVKNNWIPQISNFIELEGLNSIAKVLNKKQKVCLTFDTGMGRMGFLAKDFFKKINLFDEFKNLEIDSISSHFPCADEDKSYTLNQLKVFKKILRQLREKKICFKSYHIANSAGILQKYDGIKSLDILPMVRAGLMLYGATSLSAFACELKPVMSFKTRVVLVRDLPKGWRISYGGDFILPKPMRVATLAVGYGDGYQRHLSGKRAEVLIFGKRCKILGRITMDLIMVDVSNLPKIAPGEEVVLLGCQGNEEIRAEELAKKAETIPWEIFTAITKRVPRFIV